MINSNLQYLSKKLKEYLSLKTEMVNYQAVIRDVASAVDRSWIYYLMLLMAGLIALLGLLTNSVAVVIGAMLISPLMGPIISSGLALTIGDLRLARRAFKSIAISVALTLLATAVVALLSPLKEPTAEIMARVRPNIYDLFVAVLSGIVGAVALCTKRNYLITATGVAVATAVIPPLSVAGYGLGTGQFMIGVGGFFLFFTNFVAIVLTSDLVFFVMGFRTSHAETSTYSARKRWLIISGVLLLISIPLVYTLTVDLKKVKTAKRVERVLKKNLNKEVVSHLTSYTIIPLKRGVKVNVTVNTVNIIAKKNKQGIEQELKDTLNLPVELHLEQIIVASDKLPEPASPLLASQSLVPPKPDTIPEINSKVTGVVQQTEKQLVDIFAPFPVSETSLTFKKSSALLYVKCKLNRDCAVTADELLLAARYLEQSLGIPVELDVALLPLLPNITFSPEGKLAAETIKNLEIIKSLPGGSAKFRFVLKAPSRYKYKEIGTLINYLKNDLALPGQSITIIKSSKSSGITLRIVRLSEVS